MFIIVRGNVADGFSFEGPFMDHDIALEACEGEDSYWEIAPLTRPSEHSVLDTMKEVVETSRKNTEKIKSLCKDIEDSSENILRKALDQCSKEAQDLLDFVKETEEELPIQFVIGQKIRVVSGKHKDATGEVTGFGEGFLLVVQLYDRWMDNIGSHLIDASNLEPE
jgi:hypothetical protein